MCQKLQAGKVLKDSSAKSPATFGLEEGLFLLLVGYSAVSHVISLRKPFHLPIKFGPFDFINAGLFEIVAKNGAYRPIF